MTAPIELPDAFRELALPRRDRPERLPIPNVDPGAASGAVQAIWRANHGQLRPLLDNLGAPGLSDPRLADTAEAAAMQFAVALSLEDRLVDRLVESFVDWWVAERGIAFAVNAALATPSARLSIRKHRRVGANNVRTPEFARRLRRYLVLAADDEAKQVEATLATCQSDPSHGFASSVVMIAPHRVDWVQAALTSIHQGRSLWDHRLEDVMLALDTVDDVTDLTSLTGLQLHPSVVPTLLLTIGAPLKSWLEFVAEKRNPPPTDVQMALEAVGAGSGDSLPAFFEASGFDDVLGADAVIWTEVDVEEAILALMNGGADDVRDRLTPHEGARFVDTLVKQWVQAGHPENHAWVLDALAGLGDDQSLSSLFETKSASSPLRNHRDRIFAVLLEADTAATRQLIATRDVQSRWGREELGPAAEALLVHLGVPTLDHARDASVPDLGLNIEGPRVLSLGERTVSMEVDEELEVRLRDAEGRLLKSFPRKNASDDELAYRSARFAHQRVRALVPKVAGAQRARLETALLSRRTWSGEQFRSWFVAHPIMRRFVERLLWAHGSYESPALFRVAEDGTFAGLDESVVEVSPQSSVWLHHPMRSPAEAISRWREVFADYELVQPFPQLDRPAFGPTRDDALAHARSFVGKDAAAGKWMDLKALGFKPNSSGREMRWSAQGNRAVLRFDRKGMRRMHTDLYRLDRLDLWFEDEGSNEWASEFAAGIDQVFNT